MVNKRRLRRAQKDGKDFGLSARDKQKVLSMSRNDTNKKLRMRFLQAKREQLDRFNLFERSENELLAEKIMENIHNTSLGRLLGIIASLPEIRPEKVERGRQLLRHDETNLNEQLDEAMDRVLEELLQEG